MLENKVVCRDCLMQVDVTLTRPVYHPEASAPGYICQVCKPVPRLLALKKNTISVLALAVDEQHIRKTPLLFIATHWSELDAYHHVQALAEHYQVPVLDDLSFFYKASELKEQIPVGYSGPHGMFRIVYEDGSVQSTYNPEIVEALVGDAAHNPEHVQISRCYCEVPLDYQTKLHLMRKGYLLHEARRSS